MAFTYDPSDLDTSTSSGRLNTVRLLVGDTNSSDPQTQDEEIQFALGQHSNNVYSAGEFICKIIAAKYSRLVTTQLDGVLQSNYSDLAKQYSNLAASIKKLGVDARGGLGVSAGGIDKTAMRLAELDPNRVKPAFKVGQFDNLYFQDGLEDWDY
jgi:hypothetical protein